MPDVIVNEHSRRFSRTLQQAFPISEGYRESVEGPTRDERIARLTYVIVEVVCWGSFVGFVGFMGWMAWNTPKVPW